MGKSCRDMAEALYDCMSSKECMLSGGSLKHCIKNKQYKEDCKEYRHAYFVCKRGQLDMRSRIRGPKGGQDIK